MSDIKRIRELRKLRALRKNALQERVAQIPDEQSQAFVLADLLRPSKKSVLDAIRPKPPAEK